MSLQNEPLTPVEGYAETAYRADAIPEQSYAPENERLRYPRNPPALGLLS